MAAAFRTLTHELLCALLLTTFAAGLFDLGLQLVVCLRSLALELLDLVVDQILDLVAQLRPRLRCE